MHDGLRAGEHVGPVVAAELGGAAHAGPEGGAGAQLWWCPGVPVGDRGEGAREVDFVHGGGDVRCVGPVPEETALFDGHGCGCGCD